MESRNWIKTLLGKESILNTEDLKTLISNHSSENSFFECKKITAGMRNANIRKLIMPELAAFLNKNGQEGGLLALGIDAKNKILTEICGVEETLIRNDSSLRDWIIHDIFSVPGYTEFPDLEIEAVNFEEGKKIYLIEVHPNDKDVLYFTRTDNCAYKREADETKQVPAEETVRIIESKRVAKLFVTLEELESRIEGDFIIYKFKIVFSNTGTRPSFYVNAMLSCVPEASCRSEDINIDLSGWQDISSLNVYLKSYSQKFNDPFYPLRPSVGGFINIKLRRDDHIQLIVEIDEEKGRSKQIFSISDHEVKEVLKHFSNYIS